MKTQDKTEALASHGFGVYAIEGGRLDPEAKYAVADPADDEDGFYLEGPDLDALVTEACDHLLEV